MHLEGPTAAGLMYSDTGGDGPVVVLLHGVLMNATLWDTVVGGLGDRYRCIVPELPFGAHTTPMPDDADLSLPSLATMIAGFLTELDLRHVTVVGNDWGGAQLVISPGGTFLTAQLLRPRWIRHLPLTFGALSKRRVPDDLFRSWIHPLRHNPKVRRDLNKYLRNVPKPKQLLEWADQQRTFAGPVLIVWARHDKLMPPTHAERLAQHFQNTHLVWIDDSRTLIPTDHPKILTDHLSTYLATHES